MTKVLSFPKNNDRHLDFTSEIFHLWVQERSSVLPTKIPKSDEEQGALYKSEIFLAFQPIKIFFTI